MDSWANRFRQEKVRSDLSKVFVLTKGIDSKQLKMELYKEVGDELGECCSGEIYVIPQKIMEKSSYKSHSLKRTGWEINGVFIRGLVDPVFSGKTIVKAGNILLNGLSKVKKRYEGNLDWYYEEAKDLDTKNLMESYDRDLARKEFMT